MTATAETIRSAADDSEAPEIAPGALEAARTRARRPRPLAVAVISVALATAALLGGCAWNERAEAQRKAAEELQISMARDRCSRIGFTPATPDFAACVRAEIARQPLPADNADTIR